MTLLLRSRFCLVLTLCLAVLAAPASAGSIHFGLERGSDRLVLTHQGDSIAYYPQVFQLLGNGQWQALRPLSGQAKPTELLPQGKLELSWVLPSGEGPIQFALPVMVRFFDQAGAGMGQISFFNQPVATAEPLSAAYQRGWMVIEPPPAAGAIQASWLLWPQEEGIAPLAGNIDFEHQQPAARRLEWQAGAKPARLHLGKGQPAAMLLHETSRGYESQGVGDGRLRGVEQRAFWLKQSHVLFDLALATGFASLLLALWALVKKWREKQA